MTIKVVIAEDQALVREGIRTLLQLTPDITVVAECQNGSEVIATLQAHPTDVLLLDLRMPSMSGIEVLKQLQTLSAPPKTMILTTFDEHALVIECIQLGAKGYLRKDVSFDILTAGIYALARGETCYQPGLSEKIASHQVTVDDDNITTIMEPLTTSERNVLRLVAAGFSNQEIAAALHKSSGTIRNQVSSILAKLQVRDRTQAVLKAIELSLF